jgi:MFS family permease
MVGASPAVRLLVTTQLVFNTGFFMVLPFLAVHLTDGVGQGAAAVGAVLGLRTLAQQGLFVVGGVLADRLGGRAVVVAGCVSRVGGFIVLGWATSLPAIVVGVCLTGIAGALFSPAVDAALARTVTVDDRSADAARLEAFSLLNLAGQIGAVLGPLIGAALLAADFRLVCVCAASVFVVMALVHLRWFPGEDRGADAPAARLSLPRDRTFLAFALLVAVQVVVYNQLYFLLPDAVDTAWGSQTPLGVLFALAATTVVATQMSVTARLVDRAPGRVLATGMVVVGVGPLVAAAAPSLGLTGMPALLLFAVFVVSTVAGQMVIGPAVRAVIPVLARGDRLGAHYGLCASVGGILVLPVSAAVGALVDVLPEQGAAASLPWCLLAVWAFAAAVGCHRWSVLADRGPDDLGSASARG